MDHHHGPEATMSEEADPLYRPLDGLGPWTGLHVDGAAWSEAVARLDTLRGEDPDWGAMLAAAHQSAALDGMYGPDPDLTESLLRGEASLASFDESVRAHVRANLDALTRARDTLVSEASIRRVHEAACRPQLTHPVVVDGRVQDHVMAGGDYKHHPNHRRTPAGEWLPTAPVALVGPEMARVVELAGSPAFEALHPVVQAAWLHRALLHVQPFAEGNGRVARTLAGGVVLRAASVPLLFLDGDDAPTPAAAVDLVLRAVVGLVDRLAAADRSALAAWRARSVAADELRHLAVAALQRALRQRDPARRADVSNATVGDDLVVRVPGIDVEEVLVLDAHPLDDGPVSVVAREARLRLVAGDPVEPWAERVAGVLALRVAAEID